MKADRIRYLTLASREYGLPVDIRYCPPSNKGIIKHLLRQGYLVKMRPVISKRCRRSIVRITLKGVRYLEKQK